MSRVGRPILWLFLGALIPHVAFGQAPVLSFKGIELGRATRDEVLAKYPGATVYVNRIMADTRNYVVPKCGSLRAGLGECRPDAASDQLFRIGNTSSGEFVFFEVDGLVEEVEATFSSPSYSAVVAAFEEKYGKPSSAEAGEVKTMAGAVLASRSARWRLSDGEINVQERGGRTDTMRMTMTTNKLIAKRIEEQGKSVKDAAKGL